MNGRRKICRPPKMAGATWQVRFGFESCRLVFFKFQLLLQLPCGCISFFIAELLEDEVLSDGERLCVPANFLTPAGSLQAISGAPELLGAFESFMQHKTTGNRKLLVFMTSGTGEELVGNRRISQRSEARFPFDQFLP